MLSHINHSSTRGKQKMSIPRKALVFAVLFCVSNALAAEYKAGELIVKYKDGAVRTRTTMNVLYNMAGVKSIKRFNGLMKGFEHFVLNQNIDLNDAMTALRMHPAIEYVQPNYILTLPRRIVADDSDVGGSEEAPPCIFPGIPFPPGCDDSGGGGENPWPSPEPEPAPPAKKPALMDSPAEVIPPVADPNIASAYGLEKIGATQVWNDFRGSKDFVVAVIDTGIDYNHEDLSFNVWRNPNPKNNDIAGYDFVHNDGLPYDDQGHGTHTSGTVGAVGGNGVGVSGVNQHVSIMGVKFLNSEGSGTSSDAVRSIDYAITNGAKVLSNSWGGPGDEENQILLEAVKRAEAKGVLFIAAAGNEGADNDGSKASYPAAFNTENMIAVAATDKGDKVPYWSNYGAKSVHLAAPGAAVYSTVPGNRYKSESGTSMACPHVAGAAALLWAKNPSWDFKKVKEVLLKTVDPVSSLSGKTITGGRLNVLNALRYKE